MCFQVEGTISEKIVTSQSPAMGDKAKLYQAIRLLISNRELSGVDDKTFCAAVESPVWMAMANHRPYPVTKRRWRARLANRQYRLMKTTK